LSAAPTTRAEIQGALTALHTESVAYWRRFDTPTFLALIGDAWSPAQNVRHLTKSMRAVTRALQMPPFAVLLLFGPVRHVGRSYEQVREVYQARLARGADAGPYAPGASPVSADPVAARARIMEYHAAAVRELLRAVGSWSERALDTRQLPHPLLGKLTVREMLFFTLYHNRHHIDVVQRRIASTERPSGT
jgi:hypothetical protein